MPAPYKLRLLVTSFCPRNCEGCCNKDYDLAKLPVVRDLNAYNEVILTGGEPLLFVDEVVSLVKELHWRRGGAKVYVYTALLNKPERIARVLDVVDGVTITAHDPEDAMLLPEVYAAVGERPDKSIRLNVFRGVDAPPPPSGWIVKSDITWIKNCPLPADEVFMRLAVPLGALEEE